MWVLVMVITSYTYGLNSVKTQSVLPGFDSYQSCLDFGYRWYKLNDDSSSKFNFNCMKK